MKHVLYKGLSLMLLAGLLASCQPSEPESLVIYSGRSMALVDGLVDRFTEQTGIPAEVRYGRDAQLLATLQEEGDQSPADLFWANTTGALGEAINADLLTPLPDSILARPQAFTPSGGRWAPVTTRFRVLAYNSDQVSADDLPSSVMDLPDLTEFEGRIGWTPAYSSFQDFITAMRTLHGSDTTQAWLEGVQALEPKAYTSNTPMIQALAAGEIDIALTNHYYVLRLKYGGEEGEYEDEEEEEEHEEEEHEEGAQRPDAPVATYHFAPGDVGNLALVTGAGLLRTSDASEQALQFLSFLLSPEAQAFAAEEVNEYPVVSTVDVPEYLLPVNEALELSPEFDFDQLRDLDATLALMRDAGLL